MKASKYIIQVQGLSRDVSLTGVSLKNFILRVLRAEKVGSCGLTLVLARAPFIRALNKKFHYKDRPTDVLSFDLRLGSEPSGCLFADIIVSTDAAKSVSKSLCLPIKEELSRYIIHGILHLTGYDDRSKAKRIKMWKRQEELHKRIRL